MFSTKVSVILSVGFILIVHGIVSESKSAHDVAFKCIKASLDTDNSALQSGQGHKSEDQLIEAGCKFEREFIRCITNTNPDEYASSTPNIVHSLVFFHWQQLFIGKKAGLCKDIQFDKLKKIAVNSGIMAKENLPNVEEDTYIECVGIVVRKCAITTEHHMKQGYGNSQNVLSSSRDYIKCYEDAVKSCDATILRHFLVILKAYGKRLEEILGNMNDNINVPSQ